MAGNIFVPILGWNQVMEQTCGAGIWPLGIIEVDTGKRVLKDGGRPPRSAHRAAIAALFQEVQFELEYFQNVAIIG
jgi:hypothetical protein